MVEEKEKYYIYAVIIFVCIILIFVIALIWVPSFDNKMENINKVVITNNYNELQEQNYTNILNNLLLIKNYDLLYEKIDEAWLEENNYNKDSLYKWLFENFIISNDKPVIIDIDSIDSGNEYYFRFEIQGPDNKIKYVVINETLPNIYTISFEQDRIENISGKTYEYEENGIIYKVKILNVLDNVIQYELNVINNNDEYMYYNFNSIDTVTLNLDNGLDINATDITTYAINEYEISSGASFTINIVFNIDIKRYGDIKYLTLNNVQNDDGAKIVKIPLEGEK